jgi:hypothetical protein
MRVILSRKGLDSAAVGMPSPIIDGRPVPVPIPGRRSPSMVTYGDLGLSKLVEPLSRGRLTAASLCHLDPYLDPDRLPRRAGWRGAFGQCGAAQTHLERMEVGPGLGVAEPARGALFL